MKSEHMEEEGQLSLTRRYSERHHGKFPPNQRNLPSQRRKLLINTFPQPPLSQSASMSSSTLSGISRWPGSELQPQRPV